MPLSSELRDTVTRVAQEEGIDPSYALAVAERESSFDPGARASKSIFGLYQMSGPLRYQYGAGDSTDPEVQTRAFARFTRDLQGEMAGVLGRAPTAPEVYLGHYWGGTRAARVLASDGSYSPGDVFTPYELASNPELSRGTSMSGIASKIVGDIGQRMSRYGGAGAIDFASYGTPEPIDFAQFGSAADQSSSQQRDGTAGQSRPGADVDLSQYGMTVG